MASLVFHPISERCLWILYCSFVHSYHVFFVSISDITDLILILTKLVEKDLIATFQHSEWLAHWGTTITAQNKVPYLLLIGPNRVFIIYREWHAYCCLVETCFEKQPYEVAVYLFFYLSEMLSWASYKKFSLGFLGGYSRHEYDFSIASEYAVIFAVFSCSLLGVLTESGAVVRFYSMVNLRDLRYLFCSRERSLLLTLDQTEENTGTGSTGRLVQVKRKQGAQLMTGLWSLVKFRLERKRRTHDDSHLMQKYGSWYFAASLHCFICELCQLC